ncbi:MAG: DNA methyltransferase [Chloroflexi bacterium]|nr:MAG: DNA methyltransferase [Chloroflexota bacterium]
MRKSTRRKAGRNELLQPFLKWAGGKRQLLPYLRDYFPEFSSRATYFEPFLGAGAVLFDLQPHKAHVNDANTELINCYEVIKCNPEALIEDIRRHENTSEYYYQLRELDRSPDYEKLSPVQRASRIIFLNKTCYNGLFRVNSQGHFNVPYGNYKNPTIIDEIVIRAISSYLNKYDITLTNLDFAEAVKTAKRGDVVYFDPPYDPISDTSSFTGYNLDKFGRDEQRRLKSVFDELTARGCKVLLSNSSTEFIEALYVDYQVFRIRASRNINSVATGRGQIDEFLILNYDPDIKK